MRHFFLTNRRLSYNKIIFSFPNLLENDDSTIFTLTQGVRFLIYQVKIELIPFCKSLSTCRRKKQEVLMREIIAQRLQSTMYKTYGHRRSEKEGERLFRVKQEKWRIIESISYLERMTVKN